MERPELERALRTMRTEIARERGIPAFYVLSNATLLAIARTAPRTRDELLAIKGIGPRRLKDFGQAILETIGRLVDE